MKRYLKYAAVLGLVVLMTLAGASVVSASGPGPILGFGAHGRVGGSASLEAIAQKLGMTTDELSAQLRDGAKLADLADKAGVSLADLKSVADAAEQAAVKDAIQQAVTNGQLTQAQADWMLQGIEKGYTARGIFGGRGLFGFGQSADQETGLDAAAKALNMTTDELSLQLWGGRTLADLAERAGVELTTVQKAIEASRTAALKAAIQQAVTDGRLTQAQADWMLQGIENGYLPRGGMMGRGGFGGRGFCGRGFGGEFRGGQVPPTQQNQSDSTDNSNGARFRAPVLPAGRAA